MLLLVPIDEIPLQARIALVGLHPDGSALVAVTDSKGERTAGHDLLRSSGWPTGYGAAGYRTLRRPGRNLECLPADSRSFAVS